MRDFTERDLNYAVDNGIIYTADVLNQIENMKREQILKEYGDRIHKTKGGYYFRIQDKTLENGEYRRRSKDKHVLEDLLVQYCKNKEKREQESETKENETFEQLFFEYIEHKKAKVTKNTISRIMSDWKKYYVPREDFIHKPFKQITKIDVDDFLNDVVNQPNGIKAKAFRNMCGIVKHTFAYAVDAEYISKSPYRVEVNKRQIIPTTKKDSEKEVFTIQEQKLLFAEMERRLTKNPSNSIPLAIMLNFETGLRIGELLALKETDIIEEDNIKKLHICRQVAKNPDLSDLNNIVQNIWTVENHTKTERGNRIIPLSFKALEYINRIIEINKQNNVYKDGYLFLTENGTIITQGSVSEQLKKACDKVNILRRSMHNIRKTYASKLFARDVPITVISKLLGHADESTTLRYYIFNIYDSQETDTIILNALSSTDNTNNTTSCKKTVTNGDNKILTFQPVEKSKKASKYKAFN